MQRFHGWNVVWTAFVVAVFAWGVGFYGPAVYLQTLHAAHGWNIAAISGAVTLHFAFSAVIILTLPQMQRRFGMARMTVAGALLLAAGLSAWANAAAPWQLYPAALVSGAGWALTSGVTINALVALWFDRDRPRALSLAYNGASFGGILFAPLLVFLIASLGFKAAALVLGGACIVVLAFLALRYLRHTPADLGLAVDGDETPVVDPRPAPTRSRAEILVDPRFLTLSAPFALALFAQIGLFTHLLARLAPVTGAAVAAAALSLATVCAIVGRTLAGRLIGGRDRRVIAAANFLLQACGVALLVAGEVTPTLLAGCVLFGLGVGNLTSLPPLIAQKTFNAGDIGTVVALITAINQAVLSIGPGFLGLLRDATGSYTLAFGVAAALQVVAAAIILYGRRFDS